MGILFKGLDYVLTILNIMNIMNISEAIKVLITALNNDADYRESWKSSIAMAYKDAEHRYRNKTGKNVLNSLDKHIVANEAAEEFLQNFVKK